MRNRGSWGPSRILGEGRKRPWIAVLAILPMILGLMVAVSANTATAAVPQNLTLDTGGIDQVDGGGDGQSDITGSFSSAGGTTFGWAWDDPSLSGANSNDTCTYVMDPDGTVSAICFSVLFNADGTVEKSSTTVYDCGLSYKRSTCTGGSWGEEQTSKEYEASCVTVNVVDPYFTGDPDQDLQVTCTLSAIGSGDVSKLHFINTCSKPSAEPNAVSKDCIFDPNLPDPGFLQLVKVVSGGTAVATDFTLTATGPQTITGAGDTGSDTVVVGTYALTESTVTGYEQKSLTCTGVDRDGTPISVPVTDGKVAVGEFETITCTFTNALAVKTLTVAKTTVGGDGTFNFTIACTNPDSTQTVAVTTASGAGATTVSVPSTANCTATEAPATGWTLTSSTPFDASGKATFTNAKDGSLIIKKTGTAPADAVFSIKYTCGDITGTVDLKVGGSDTIDNIPADTKCTVEEAANLNYTVTYDKAEVTIPAGNSATVTVNNVRNLTTLTIDKTAIGGTGTFTFNVKCTGPGGEEFVKEGVTIDGTGIATVADVPTNLSCVVTEVNIPVGFTATSATVTVPSGGTAKFTNTGKGSLVITKVNKGGPTGEVFTINYSCSDGTKGAASLADGEIETVNDIIGGSTCDVTETPTGYTATIATSPATIEVGKPTTVTVTNTRDLTKFTIYKVTKGGDGTFSFHVVCKDADETVTKDVTVTTSGLKGEVTIDGIPTGLTCTVTEAADKNWAADKTELAAPAGSYVTFTNTKKEPVVLKKFYDANHNGTQDTGELGIAGWQIKLGGTTYTTDADGTVTVLMVPGTYTATEGTATSWVNTTPKTATTGAPGSATFGNLCLGSGNSHTIGWWQNKNGIAYYDKNGDGKIDSAAQTLLAGLPLVDAAGKTFDPTTVAQLTGWFGKATATNMAYMLSAQLASTRLSILYGFGSTSTVIYAPGVIAGQDYITVAQLLKAATDALAADGYTPAGDANREYEALLVKALTALNNGTNVPQAKPCPTPATFTF